MIEVLSIADLHNFINCLDFGTATKIANRNKINVGLLNFFYSGVQHIYLVKDTNCILNDQRAKNFDEIMESAKITINISKIKEETLK